MKKFASYNKVLKSIEDVILADSITNAEKKLIKRYNMKGQELENFRLGNKIYEYNGKLEVTIK